MSSGGQILRVAGNSIPAPSTRPIVPPSYQCQAPGCNARSATVACAEHLAMLPLHIQGALTNALATGEPGSYGPAMAEAQKIWTKISEK